MCHNDTRRRADRANPWLRGVCERSVRWDGVLRTVLHHLLQELNDDLGGRTDQHLALATLLGVEDAAKAVVQHRDAHHPVFQRGDVIRDRCGTAEAGQRNA